MYGGDSKPARLQMILSHIDTLVMTECFGQLQYDRRSSQSLVLPDSRLLVDPATEVAPATEQLQIARQCQTENGMHYTKTKPSNCPISSRQSHLTRFQGSNCTNMLDDNQ